MSLNETDATYWLVTPDKVLAHYRPAKELPLEVVADLCQEVTREIEKSCKRKFVTRTYTDEAHDGTGSAYLRLNNPPITSLTAVKLDDVAQTLTDFRIDDSETGLLYASAGFSERPGWRLEQSSGIGSAAGADEARSWLAADSGSTAGIWKITYVGGFAVDSDELADLRLIARKMVIFQIRESSMLGTASQSAGGYTETRWAMGDQGWEQERARVLSRYRLRVLGARK